MNRTILFRGKRTDNGEWAVGYLGVFKGVAQVYVPFTEEEEAENKGHIFSAVGGLWHTVDPSTVGQYTGLADKNGKRIFEGDVCRFREWENGDMCWIGAVCFEHQQFVIIGGPNKECETSFHLQMSRFVPRNIERIGTVHDNPELLKQGDADGV